MLVQKSMKRALISVYDKTGIVEFVKGLKKNGFSVISTGGTLKTLEDGNVGDVVHVSEITGFPEILDGRVKTVHPKLLGGILALRDNKVHMIELKRHKILSIDLVVCNFYPFKKVTDQSADMKTALECIDIGGPNMIRTAAKNFQDVVVVVNPKRYNQILKEYKQNGEVTLKTRKALATEAFKKTAQYDRTIYRFLKSA
jgi:phosphoribosylaminoimidazolecarboxamide formyltransferase/IMP cyclohydrolase